LYLEVLGGSNEISNGTLPHLLRLQVSSSRKRLATKDHLR
jgi:hypothetical protein